MSSRITRTVGAGSGRPQRQRVAASRAAQLVSQLTGAGTKRPPAVKKNIPSGSSAVGGSGVGDLQVIPPTLAGGSHSHRDVRKGILSASELNVGDVFAVDEGDEIPDLVSIARFPPGIAAVLRRKLNRDFERRVLGKSASDSDPQSSRGPLGLSISPTTQEDYRVFDVVVDVMTKDELDLIQKWHGEEKVNPAKYPPMLLPQTVTQRVKPPGGGSSRSSTVQEGGSSAPLSTPSLADVQEPDAMPISSIRMYGVLSDLPTFLEVYKSLDGEAMAKSANVSQILVVFFPEDELTYFPTKVVGMSGAGKHLHHCVEQVQQTVDQVEQSAGAEAALDTLLSDPEKLNAPKCPWLWPSGLTVPMMDYRERRLRDTSFTNKTEIHSAEIELLNIIKNGRQEYAQIETCSALEAYVQQEAMEANSSVTQREQVLQLGPHAKLVYVVPDLPSEFLDDPPSDWSDQVFGDERGSDLAVLRKESVTSKATAATAATRKKKRSTAVQEAEAVALVESQMGLGVATTLGDEFATLAQAQAEQQRLADLEAEFDAEFFSGAVVGESGSSVAGGGLGLGESVVGSSAVGGLDESPPVPAMEGGAGGELEMADTSGLEGGLTSLTKMTLMDKSILKAARSKRKASKRSGTRAEIGSPFIGDTTERSDQGAQSGGAPPPSSQL